MKKQKEKGPDRKNLMTEEISTGRPHQSAPNAKLIKKIDVLTAFFVVVKIIMQLDVDKIEETVL